MEQKMAKEATLSRVKLRVLTTLKIKLTGLEIQGPLLPFPIYHLPPVAPTKPTKHRAFNPREPERNNIRDIHRYKVFSHQPWNHSRT